VSRRAEQRPAREGLTWDDVVILVALVGFLLAVHWGLL
jgi:uncharacterized protein YciW